MVRACYVDQNGIKKGAWSEEEDNKLKAYIQRYGHWNWRLLPQYAGLSRCGKSCRLRWVNYLKPGLKKGNITLEERDLIVKLHKKLGDKWSAIAQKLPGRSDNEIKNYWNTHIRRKMKQTPNPTDLPPEYSSETTSGHDTDDENQLQSSQTSESGGGVSPNGGMTVAADLMNSAVSSSSCSSSLSSGTDGDSHHETSSPDSFSDPHESIEVASLGGGNNFEAHFDGALERFWNEPFLVESSFITSFTMVEAEDTVLSPYLSYFC